MKAVLLLFKAKLPLLVVFRYITVVDIKSCQFGCYPRLISEIHFLSAVSKPVYLQNQLIHSCAGQHCRLKYFRFPSKLRKNKKLFVAVHRLILAELIW